MALIPNSAVNRQEGFENIIVLDFFGRKTAASKLDRKSSSCWGVLQYSYIDETRKDVRSKFQT